MVCINELAFKALGFFELMQRLQIGRLVECQSFISGFVNHVKDRDIGIKLDAEQIPMFEARLIEFANLLENAGANLMARIAKDALAEFKNCEINEKGELLIRGQARRDFFSKLRNLTDLTGKELDTNKFYVMPPGAAPMYEVGDLPFGQDVEFSFANGEDLVESGNCLALGRYTACVFHLMRAMELAVKVLAGKIDVTLSDKYGRDLPWGRLLAQFEDKIKLMDKTDQPKWRECHSLLSSVNIAWRHETMHPKQTYTEEEAKAVFTAVEAFMKKLAPLAW